MHYFQFFMDGGKKSHVKVSNEMRVSTLCEQEKIQKYSSKGKKLKLLYTVHYTIFSQFVCKDDQFDKSERMKVKRTSDPKCEALQEMSQI